jgi:hypothetical protein
MEDWRDGLYRRMGQTRAAMKNAAESVLVLTPEAQIR